MTKDEFFNKYSKRHLSVEWTTGGMSGGNCWGDSPSYSVEADEEPELEVLDDILMEECPTATFMEYRMLTRNRNLIVRRTWEDHEYYGNHYSRASKTLDLDVLWQYLDIMINIPDPNVRMSHYKLMED